MDPDSGCFLPIAIVEFLSTEFGGSVSWRGNVLVLGLRGVQAVQLYKAQGPQSYKCAKSFVG